MNAQSCNFTPCTMMSYTGTNLPLKYSVNKMFHGFIYRYSLSPSSSRNIPSFLNRHSCFLFPLFDKHGQYYMTDSSPLVNTYCLVIQNIVLDTLFSSGISSNITRTFEKGLCEGRLLVKAWHLSPSQEQLK